MLKRISISIPVSVSLMIDADDASGDVEIVSVVRVNGLPTAKEVMEALDYHGELDQLDEAFAEAPPPQPHTNNNEG